MPAAMKPSYAVPLALLTAAAVAGQAPQPPAGRPLVLLLDDFKVVEGTVEKAGTEYVVCRGKEVRRIPEKQVLFAGDSMPAVRQFLTTRATNSTAANAAWARQFNETVQPILANTCANCHARADHPSGFKLHTVTDRYADAEWMRRNAAATAAFLNRDDLPASPLLTKALTAHGGQREPGLRGRDQAAYRNLERWAYAATPQAANVPARPASPKTGDPFDPAEFNRMAHPGR